MSLTRVKRSMVSHLSNIEHSLAGSPVLVGCASLSERLMDDDELADKVVDIYLEDIPIRIQALRACLEAGDAAGAERQAHTINGASANVGSDALRDFAADLERAGKMGNLESMSAGMAELVVIFETFRREAGASGRNDGDGDGDGGR